MRATLEGWARVEKTHNVAEAALSLADVRAEPGSIAFDAVEIVPFNHLDFAEKRTDGRVTCREFEVWGDQPVRGGVRIRSGATLTLDGRFQFCLELSADEILLLATEATKEWPVDYLLKKLTSIRTPTTEPNSVEGEGNG